MNNSESILKNLKLGESSLARSALYKFLSYSYRYPDVENQRCLQDLFKGIEIALHEFPPLKKLYLVLYDSFKDNEQDQMEDEYIVLFGHSAQGNCPPFEIEYGESREDIQKPHDLSDIAAFYSAAGLKYSERSRDRVDFVSTELEFMHFLYLKKAYAEEKCEKELIKMCDDMQSKFLQDHLARWIPAFTRRIMQYAKKENGFYGTLASLTLEVILLSCKELGAEAGSEKLRVCAPMEVSQNCMNCSVSQNETVKE